MNSCLYSVLMGLGGGGGGGGGVNLIKSLHDRPYMYSIKNHHGIIIWITINRMQCKCVIKIVHVTFPLQ